MSETLFTESVLEQRAVLCMLTIKAFGIVRKIKGDLIDTDADKNLIKAQKLLLAIPEVRAIQQLDSEIRRWLDNRAIPAYAFKRGMYMIPQSVMELADRQLIAFKAQREALVTDLGQVYDDAVMAQRMTLRSAFNPNDYPPKREFLAHYFMDWQYLALAVPERLLTPEQRERERAKLMGTWKEIEENGVLLLKAQLIELIDHLNDKLKPKEGKKQIFRDSSLTNITDFMSTLDDRNVMRDAALDDVAAKLRGLLEGVDADMLRNDCKVTKQVQDGFAEIKTAFGDVIEAKRIRRFDLA